MRIAIFSDVHGKILLPFKLVDVYQQETGRSIDLILQCGDMGAYPVLDRLDKATIKHAKNDRDELGFHDYFVREDTAIRAFLDRLNVDMFCVRGNHEDHDFLDELEQTSSGGRFAIDVYNRVFVCKSGYEQSVAIGDEVLTFVGVGRIGDRKGREEKRFIQAYERKQLQKLLKTKSHFDILVTHDKDDGSERGYGMAEIRTLLDRVIFQYHFYGHTGEPFSETTDVNGITQSVKIKELEFEDSGVLPDGCMVVLERQQSGGWNMEVVARKITNKLTRFTWKD